jgi:hypothetical protein
MSTQNQFYEGEPEEEELDIEKENEKLYQQLLKDLGIQNKEENPKKKELELAKAFKAHSKLEQKQLKDIQLKPKSEKSLYNRINELQNELNSVSKEINDYLQIYSDNSFLKEESNFNDISKELELYSSKLQNIISSDLYKNSISGKNKITSDINQLKNEIKMNLDNYTNSTARLMGLISKEREDFMIQSNINTTTHEIFMNKNLFGNNIDINNIDNEILEIEKEITKIEGIVGKKKLDKNEKFDISKILKQLIKTINDKKFQIYKEKALNELNEVLDDLLKEKEDSIDISEYTMKIKELYAIYEIYENYDEIMKYIKKRLMAICDIHEKSTDYSSDLDFLKQLIEDNEKQYIILGKRYNDVFVEMEELENILKELKNIDKYFSSFLVE